MPLEQAMREAYQEELEDRAACIQHGWLSENELENLGEVPDDMLLD